MTLPHRLTALTVNLNPDATRAVHEALVRYVDNADASDPQGKQYGLPQYVAAREVIAELDMFFAKLAAAKVGIQPLQVVTLADSP